MTVRRSAACVISVALSCLSGCPQDEVPLPRVSAETTVPPGGEYYGVLHLRLELPAQYELPVREFMRTTWSDAARRSVSIEGELPGDPWLAPKPSRCDVPVSEFAVPPVLRSHEVLPDGFLQICDQYRGSKDHELIVVRRLRIGPDEVDCVARAHKPTPRDVAALVEICRSVVSTGHYPVDLSGTIQVETTMRPLGEHGGPYHIRLTVPHGAEEHADEGGYRTWWSKPDVPQVHLAARVQNTSLASSPCKPLKGDRVTVIEEQQLTTGRLESCRLEHGYGITNYYVFRQIKTQRGGAVACRVTLSGRATLEQVQQMTEVCRSVVVTELPPEPANRAQPRAGSADTPTP